MSIILDEEDTTGKLSSSIAVEEKSVAVAEESAAVADCSAMVVENAIVVTEEDITQKCLGLTEDEASILEREAIFSIAAEELECEADNRIYEGRPNSMRFRGAALSLRGRTLGKVGS